MNILQICSGTNLNGAAYAALETTRALARCGHRMWMACRPNSWIGQQLANDPIDVVWTDLHRWPMDELRRMAEFVHHEKIDLIHTHMSRAHLFGVILRRLYGIPCVATAHNGRFQPHWCLNDYVMAVSNAIRRYHRRWNGVRASRITTIYNFLDEERLARVPSNARRTVRESLGIDDAIPLIGSVGVVLPRKGQLHLVRALPAILHEQPQTRAVVVGAIGNTQYYEQAVSEANRLGMADRITWLGERLDALEIISALDVYVHPAIEEPLGRTVLEAMALSVPVVGSAVGGIVETVRDGVTGTLVPSANSQKLAAATVELLQDPQRRRRYGQAGTKRVQQQFSVKEHLARTEQVYRQTLQLHAGHKEVADTIPFPSNSRQQPQTLSSRPVRRAA